MFREKLLEFSKQRVMCNKWRGSNYYYKKIFYKSIYLDSFDIPEYHCRTRYYYNFDDVIYGHPLASNGLCYETLNELKKMGAIKEDEDE